MLFHRAAKLDFCFSRQSATALGSRLRPPRIVSRDTGDKVARLTGCDDNELRFQKRAAEGRQGEAVSGKTSDTRREPAQERAQERSRQGTTVEIRPCRARSMAANINRGRGFARGRSLQFTKMSVGGASQACHLSTAPQRTNSHAQGLGIGRSSAPTLKPNDLSRWRVAPAPSTPS